MRLNRPLSPKPQVTKNAESPKITNFLSKAGTEPTPGHNCLLVHLVVYSNGNIGVSQYCTSFSPR